MLSQLVEVAAAAQVQSLDWERPRAVSVAKKKKKKKKNKTPKTNKQKTVLEFLEYILLILVSIFLYPLHSTLGRQR